MWRVHLALSIFRSSGVLQPLLTLDNNWLAVHRLFSHFALKSHG